MSGATTAKPPAFHLKIRLIDDRGVPFAQHQVRVTWGKDTVNAATDANGLVVALPHRGAVLLDGDPAIEAGRLELGPLEGQPYTTAMTIPLVKHTSREVSANIAPRQWAPQMWHDIAWRLANLGYFTDNPTSSDPGSDPSPLRVTQVSDAMLRFKAKNHVTLGLVDWLDPAASTSKHRLTDDQDDRSVTLLLFQHDYLPIDSAADKLANAIQFKKPL